MQRENDNLSPSSKGGVKSGNGGEGAMHSPGKNRPGTGKNTAKVLTSSKKTSAAAVHPSQLEAHLRSSGSRPRDADPVYDDDNPKHLRDECDPFSPARIVGRVKYRIR